MHASIAIGKMTISDQYNGYTETKAALVRSSTDSLVDEYKDLMRHTFGMFGHNAKEAINLIALELVSRGITEIPNLFGPYPVRTNW